MRIKINSIKEAQSRIQSDRLKSELLLRYAKQSRPGEKKDVFRPITQGSKYEQKLFETQSNNLEINKKQKSNNSTFYKIRNYFK